MIKNISAKATALLCLILVVFCAACKDDSEKPPIPHLPVDTLPIDTTPPFDLDTVDVIETWFFNCEINPVTITLYIDSNNMVYVKTEPEKIFNVFLVPGYDHHYYGYFFGNYERYSICENGLYHHFSEADPNWLFFRIKKESENIMKITLSENVGYTCDFVPIKNYLFIKQ